MIRSPEEEKERILLVNEHRRLACRCKQCGQLYLRSLGNKFDLADAPYDDFDFDDFTASELEQIKEAEQPLTKAFPLYEWLALPLYDIQSKNSKIRIDKDGTTLWIWHTLRGSTVRALRYDPRMSE